MGITDSAHGNLITHPWDSTVETYVKTMGFTSNLQFQMFLNICIF